MASMEDPIDPTLAEQPEDLDATSTAPIIKYDATRASNEAVDDR